MRKNGLLSLIIISVIAVGWLTYTLTLGGGSPQLGLDLQGGTSVVLAPKTQTNIGAIDQAIEIIRRRVDGLGVAEPEIIRQGNFIVVSLPGVKDQERAIQVVGRTAKLQFRPVCRSLSIGLGDAQYEQALTSGSCGPAVAATSVPPSTTSDTTPTTQAGLGA